MVARLRLRRVMCVCNERVNSVTQCARFECVMFEYLSSGSKVCVREKRGERDVRTEIEGRDACEIG